MTHMSAEEYRNINSKKKKVSKYRSRYIYVYEDGLASEQKDLVGHGAIVRKYDSKKEYARHKELELLERGGAIYLVLGIACLLMGVLLLVDHIRREREEKAKKQDAADADKE